MEEDKLTKNEMVKIKEKIERTFDEIKILDRQLLCVRNKVADLFNCFNDFCIMNTDKFGNTD